MNGEINSLTNSLTTARLQTVLFARTPDAGVTIGVVTDAEPSSLSLLAAGVAGMAARRARRARQPDRKKPTGAPEAILLKS